jgi:hypothetical protein
MLGNATLRCARLGRARQGKARPYHTVGIPGAEKSEPRGFQNSDIPLLIGHEADHLRAGVARHRGQCSAVGAGTRRRGNPAAWFFIPGRGGVWRSNVKHLKKHQIDPPAYDRDQMIEWAAEHFAEHCNKCGAIYQQPCYSSSSWDQTHVRLYNVRGLLAAFSYAVDRDGRVFFALDEDEAEAEEITTVEGEQAQSTEQLKQEILELRRRRRGQ